MYTYKVLKHDCGWAYEANGTHSERFPTHAAARKAARLAASEQARPGEATPGEATPGEATAGEATAGETTPLIAIDTNAAATRSIHREDPIATTFRLLAEL
jgi:hypothetical protein